MTQYRIKELKGLFTIEGSYERTSNAGKWWNKNIVTKTYWSKSSYEGKPISAYNSTYIKLEFLMPPKFKSLEEAQDHVDKHILKTKPLETGIDKPIYHQVGEISEVDK